jgi:ABC-type cobalamin/Fe3+-siderophores transport system ATPase subunit
MFELDKIEVKKFKRIDDIKMDVADLNILVGSNGSGKSSILQALHLASCLMRQADRIRPSSTSMVRVVDLDYLPSDQYWRLGHGADWGNVSTSPSSNVTFSFSDENGTISHANLTIRSARNAGISVQGSLPDEIRTQFRGENTYFSGFIPGISGIPNVEAKNARRAVLKACSFGDSNVYLRNALNLLTSDQIIQIQDWLLPLLGEVRINVLFDDYKDMNISAEAELNGAKVPLELLGTGYLQLIQIFCYVLLFKPKILLVDEPDIHLHPTVQEALPAVLAGIADSQNLKIVLSTHSPFIVRGAPATANVVWLDKGEVISNDKSLVDLALGWGAFGKKVIIATEDAKNDFLKKLIKQWPEIDRMVTVLPGRGYKQLLKKDEAEELRLALGGKFKILVHRDRDSLTDQETADLMASYASDGVQLWFTEQSDIEAEFCSPAFVSSLTGESIEQCEQWLSEVLQSNAVPVSDQFAAQRQAHNQELYAQGGSPINGDVWQQFQLRPLKGAKGKFVFNQLKNKVTQNRFTDQSVLALEGHNELTPSLKAALEALIL